MSISAPAIPKIRENGIEIPIDIRAQNIRLSDTAGGMDIETAIGDLRNNPFDLTHIERMIEDLQGQFAYFPYFVTREELKNQLDNISNALTEATKVILKDFAALKELEKLQAEISRLDKLENEIKYLATRIDKIELLGRKVGIADTPEDLHMALDDFLPMIPTINDFAIVNNPAQIWIIEAISPETGAIKWQAGPMLNTNIDLSGFARQEDLADLADEIEELRKKGDVNGFAATISADGIAREFIINHELDSLAVSVSVISLMANALVFVLWKIIDSNNIKIIFDQAPINENFRIIING